MPRPRKKPMNRPPTKMLKCDWDYPAEERKWNKFEREVIRDNNKDRILFLLDKFEEYKALTRGDNRDIKLRIFEGIIGMFAEMGFDNEARLINHIRPLILWDLPDDRIERFEITIGEFLAMENTR